MSRTARVVVPEMPMHITQRGSRRLDVFRDESNRIDYLELLRNCCRNYRMRLLAYCLMTNHVHSVAIADRLDSIRLVFHRLNGTHSQRFNRKYKFVGHLWQERRFSCVPDESHLMNAIRYVEQNPVRAKMVANRAEYPWSSAAAHCSGYEDPWLDIESPPFTIPDWRQRLNTGSNGQADEFLRECTTTGRPCGDSAFVLRIEEKSNRDFTRKKPGPKANLQQEQTSLRWPEDSILN
jgi:putative transposase